MWPKMRHLLAPEGVEGTGSNAPATETPAATPAAQAETAAPETTQVTSATGKVIPLAQTTIDKIKREQLERGRKAAAADFEKKAKALGFGSAEEMFLSIEKKQRAAKDQPKKPAQQTAKPGQKKPEANAQPAGRNHRREDRQQREMQARLDRERRDRIRAQKKAEQAERDQWAAEAHGELKVIALGVGIKDPDYAAILLTRECEQKRSMMESDEKYDEWLNSFDEKVFFESLKKTRPALFQEEVRPATTGITKTDDSPPPPGAGKVVEAAANGAQKNVRGMSRDDFHKELQRRGLSIPTT